MNHFVLLIAFIFICNATHSQEEPAELGKKHQVSLSFVPYFATMNTSLTDNMKLMGIPAMGFGASIIYDYSLSRYFSIQGGLIYNSVNYHIVIDHNNHYVIDFENIYLPLMITLNTAKFNILNYSIFLGPQGGINLPSTMKLPTYTNNTRDTAQIVLKINPVEFGMAYGMGADFAVTKKRLLRFDVGFRGSLGFTSRGSQIRESNQVNIISDYTTMNTFGGYVGFKFGF